MIIGDATKLRNFMQWAPMQYGNYQWEWQWKSHDQTSGTVVDKEFLLVQTQKWHILTTSVWAAHQNWVSWMPYNVIFETPQLKSCLRKFTLFISILFSSFSIYLSTFKVLTEQHYLNLIRSCFYAIMRNFPSGINKGCLSIFDMVWNSLHLSCWQNTKQIFLYL